MLQLVRQPARLLEPLDLALAIRPDDPEAILAKRVHATSPTIRKAPGAFVSQAARSRFLARDYVGPGPYRA